MQTIFVLVRNSLEKLRTNTICFCISWVFESIFSVIGTKNIIAIRQSARPHPQILAIGVPQVYGVQQAGRGAQGTDASHRLLNIDRHSQPITLEKQDIRTQQPALQLQKMSKCLLLILMRYVDMLDMNAILTINDEGHLLQNLLTTE